MIWTEEAINRISPDTLTFERAKAISSTRYWKQLTGNEKFIAGECQSTGQQVYKTLVELDDPKFYCSCQQDKQPCKHALALLLIFLESSHLLVVSDQAPDWFKPLHEKALKKQKESKQIQKKKAVQQAKTRDVRFQLMETGIKELETWLFDFIRQGLAVSDTQTSAFWDDFAARMVDAKLGAVGKKIRLLKNITHSNNWHERLLQELGDLYLFVRAFQKLEKIPDLLQQELLNYAGVTIKKDDLIQQDGVKDEWLVIGQVQGMDENLNFRRTWLKGAETGQMALILDFVWGRGAFPMDWKPGHVIHAELVYYPAAYPLRAILKNFEWSKKPFEGLRGFARLENFIKSYAEAVAKNPWMNTFPVFLEKVVPVLEQEQFYLVDSTRKKIKPEVKPDETWKMLAVSGGLPVALFSEWDGYALRPLSIITDGRIIPL